MKRRRPGRRAEGNPRRLAVEILNRIEEKGAYAEPLLDEVLTKTAMGTQDRRLLTHIVYGTLRARGRYDWIIGQLYAKGVDTLDTEIRNILRVGLHQLLTMDRIPDYAVIDEAVETTKAAQHRAGAGLVNALLRRYVREGKCLSYPDPEKEPTRHLAVLHSHPEWLVEMWVRLLGLEEAAELCRANNEIPPLTVRSNRLKVERDVLARRLSEEGCEARYTVYSPDGLVLSGLPGTVRGLRAFAEGCFVVQDEASQLVSRLLAPLPGETVIDVCAGSGIKTIHLAALMNNEGRIVALDINPRKLALLKELAGRLRVTIIEAFEADALEKPQADLQCAFDRVLVDVPCSGLGTLRRNPEIKWRLTPEEMKKFPTLQKRILANAAQCVKKGGVLVYSTCTISGEENEGVVQAFLAENDGFTVVEPPQDIDARLVDAGFFKTYPHRHGTDGFFGAVLRRHDGDGQKN